VVRAAPPEAAPAVAAIPAVPEVSAPIIDWAAAAARFKGRTAFVDRLAGIARADCREMPDVLRAAVRVADRDSIAFIAHSLKSVSGNLAMNALFTLASRTERAARDDAPDAMALTEQLAQGVEQMLAEIDRRLG
jgi:HPt (histidine-containing phosphotransfer) domain-containing protein